VKYVKRPGQGRKYVTPPRELGGRLCKKGKRNAATRRGKTKDEKSSSLEEGESASSEGGKKNAERWM